MIEKIVQVVLDELQIDNSFILSAKKNALVIKAKTLIAYHSLKCGYTQVEIAKYINVSCSNVWYCAYKYAKFCKNDNNFKLVDRKVKERLKLYE